MKRLYFLLTVVFLLACGTLPRIEIRTPVPATQTALYAAQGYKRAVFHLMAQNGVWSVETPRADYICEECE